MKNFVLCIHTYRQIFGLVFFYMFLSVAHLGCEDNSASLKDAGFTGFINDSDAGSFDGGVVLEELPATEYCEKIAGFFCEYYLRCGRMAGVETQEECEIAFLSSCNDGYEQRYVDLAEQNLLHLSAAGIESCKVHLKDVACEMQIRDLDGACVQMWVGDLPSGSACGLDVEGLVCGGQSECRVDTSFCGVCEVRLSDGSECVSDGDCKGKSQCFQGVCTARPLPGEPCNEDTRCILGARCEQGICIGPARAKLGETCSRVARCPYKSGCVNGICVEKPLLGASCSLEVGCASGFCDNDICVARYESSMACTSSDQCRSRQCLENVCTALPGVCFVQ